MGSPGTRQGAVYGLVRVCTTICQYIYMQAAPCLNMLAPIANPSEPKGTPLLGVLGIWGTTAK